MVDTENYKFQQFYELKLYSKYNIKTSYEGCLASDNDFCYTERMNELIEKKYGKGFWKKNRKIAEKDFRELPESEFFKIIDLEKVYESNLDSYPKFIGNDKVVSQFFQSISKIKKEDIVYYINTTIRKFFNFLYKLFIAPKYRLYFSY